MKNWSENSKEVAAQLRNLRGCAPEVMKAFGGIAQALLAGKALDGKTKELIRDGYRCGGEVRRLHRLSRQGYVGSGGFAG
jgi:hypothetical protein